MRPSAADLRWIQAGIARHPVAVVVSLFVSWTFAWVAVWIGTIIMVVGMAFAVIQAATGNPLGVAGGLVFGVIFGILGVGGFYGAIFASGLLTGVLGMAGALVFGALLAFGLTVGVMYAEPWVLRLRGYRRLSLREAAAVEPILEELARRMGLDYLPLLMIADDGRPAAWTHCRHIVLTTGMVNAGIPDTGGLNRQRLTAVLAHELAHWHAGDGIGATAVWAAALPLMLVYSVAAWLTRGRGQRPNVVTLICYVTLWPAFLLTRLVIAPIYAWEGRKQEYEADANAVRLGLGPALAETLSYMSMFEPARSGWSEVLTAEHPPTELRLEALEAQPGRTTRREAPQTPPADPPPDKRSEPRIPEPQRGAVPTRGLRGIQPEPRPAVFPIEKDVPPSQGPDLWVPSSHYGPGRPPTNPPPSFCSPGPTPAAPTTSGSTTSTPTAGASTTSVPRCSPPTSSGQSHSPH